MWFPTAAMSRAWSRGRMLTGGTRLGTAGRCYAPTVWADLTEFTGRRPVRVRRRPGR
jgi:hypothetical protein